MGDDGDLRTASGEQLTGLAKRYYGLERNGCEPDSELRGRCLALVHTDRVNTGDGRDVLRSLANAHDARHRNGGRRAP
jgi:hypothetical protein